MLEQFVGTFSIRWKHGAADTRIDTNAAPFEVERTPQLPENRVAQLRWNGPLDQDRELVASETSDQIARTEALVQSIPDLLQQQVAGAVAETVVHMLEMIQIEQEQTDRTSGMHCA